MCKLCKLWTHCPERASKTFSSKGSRDRHIERWHDPWYDLEVKMITDDKLVFKCPSEDYQGTSTFDVRLHCLSASCVDHGKYVDMEANAKHRFKVTAEGSIEVQHDEEATQAVEPVVKGDESDQDLGVAFLSAGVDAVVEAAQNRGITITPEQRENLEGLYMSLQVAQAVRTTDQRDHHTHHAAVRRAALSLFIDGRCAELLALLDISDTA
ncbi:hypothetical protein BD410DRAFT_327617 [Rickenella mellea]|uniref:Uncharacterized protein n=1 Tax=Rickenella mellea TaxID=50990 RepID=A0A4Y7QLM8_9AGAM|nr:hypothetical protein BD410DRAFT_327617 [Rickenella mellea]